MDSALPDKANKPMQYASAPFPTPFRLIAGTPWIQTFKFSWEIILLMRRTMMTKVSNCRQKFEKKELCICTAPEFCGNQFAEARSYSRINSSSFALKADSAF